MLLLLGSAAAYVAPLLPLEMLPPTPPLLPQPSGLPGHCNAWPLPDPCSAQHSALSPTCARSWSRRWRGASCRSAPCWWCCGPAGPRSARQACAGERLLEHCIFSVGMCSCDMFTAGRAAAAWSGLPPRGQQSVGRLALPRAAGLLRLLLPLQPQQHRSPPQITRSALAMGALISTAAARAAAAKPVARRLSARAAVTTTRVERRCCTWARAWTLALQGAVIGR